MASKAWEQSFLSASQVLRHGFTILLWRQGDASTEQPTRRISGVHSPFSSPWMTLRRRYSGPDSASKRVWWPRMFGKIVLGEKRFTTGVEIQKAAKGPEETGSFCWHLPAVLHVITVAQVQLCAGRWEDNKRQTYCRWHFCFFYFKLHNYILFLHAVSKTKLRLLLVFAEPTPGSCTVLEF